MYGEPVQETVTGGVITHYHGSPWYRLDIPPAWHLCWPASHGNFEYNNLYIDRCPCGAWRRRNAGGTWTRWADRNTRRHGHLVMLTLH